MLIYKIDVLAALKKAGYNTTRLRQEQLLSERAIQSLRHNKPIGAKSLNSICALLHLQPGSIIKYVKSNESN